MITLYSFCSPDRATGKTTMMSGFLRDDAELFLLALQFEGHEVRSNFPSVKRNRITNLRSDFYRGLSHKSIDIVITAPYLDSMKDRDFQRIKDACNYLSIRSSVNIYVESLNHDLVEKLISTIHPKNIIFFDDYLNWDENHHAVGEEISLIEKSNQSIKDKGFRYFGINNTQHKGW